MALRFQIKSQINAAEVELLITLPPRCAYRRPVDPMASVLKYVATTIADLTQGHAACTILALLKL